jgi:hypothetical protein
VKLCSFAIVLAAAACGDPATDEANLISVSTMSIEDDHIVGTTECPQELGSFVVKNESEEVIDVDVEVDDVEGVDLIDFVDEDGLTIIDVFTINLPAGESFETFAMFNCANDQSFTTQISVSVGTDPANPVFITVDLNID